ncbi:MAG: DNA methyltransferase, partial [Gemmataceae bacterium]
VPELNEGDYEVLKAAIREAGRVLVPVVVTTDGEVIDGKGRIRAADELKLKDYPREVVHGLDAEVRHLMRLSLNCARRQLSAVQKREVVRAALQSLPHLSNNYLGQMTGVSDKTVAAVREDLEATSSIPKLTQFRGKDGKTRPRHVFARNAREQREASDALVLLGDDAPTKPMTARDVTRKAKRTQAEVARSTRDVTVLPPDGLVQIHHCDFRQMPVEPGSARLIFTDPLYHREHLPLYAELARWASKVLQPGGLLVTYLGTSFLPEVVQMLGDKLKYVWTCATLFNDQKTSVYERRVRSGWKPLLIFSNGPFQPHDWLVDVVNGVKDKQLHEYQQSATEATYFIERLTNVGDLVVDPFAGSGTTAATCKRLNRRCATADIDLVAVATARERVWKTTVGEMLLRPRVTLGALKSEPEDFDPVIESLTSLHA